MRGGVGETVQRVIEGLMQTEDRGRRTGCNFHKLHIRLIRLDAVQARTEDGLGQTGDGGRRTDGKV
jgi:hypothetical protein